MDRESVRSPHLRVLAVPQLHLQGLVDRGDSALNGPDLRVHSLESPNHHQLETIDRVGEALEGLAGGGFGELPAHPCGGCGSLGLGNRGRLELVRLTVPFTATSNSFV